MSVERRVRLVATAVCVAAFTSSWTWSFAQDARRDGKRPVTLLEVDWRKGPSLPQGFQDSQGGLIGNTLISVAGFCSGQQGVSGKADKYPRGFLKKVWGLDLGARAGHWHELPDFPGAARQGLQAVVVNDGLYCWGGFSYSEPYCYRDGHRLTRGEKHWTWTSLPDLPWPVTAGGLCAVGETIYLCGGADYDATRFYTAGNRDSRIERLGARLSAIDTTDRSARWRMLPDCPGTPRWVHAMAAVKGKLYIFGGATGSDNPAQSMYTVVDNWRYDVKSQKWDRLADLPIASGNFPSGAIVYRNRYIVLVGGYQYGGVLNPDGTTRKVYGTPDRHDPTNPMCSDIFVYDTATDEFGRATSMPLNNNLPMTVLRGDRLHLIGGEIQAAKIEGEHFGHHPDLYLIGSIRPAQ